MSSSLENLKEAQKLMEDESKCSRVFYLKSTKYGYPIGHAVKPQGKSLELIEKSAYDNLLQENLGLAQRSEDFEQISCEYGKLRLICLNMLKDKDTMNWDATEKREKYYSYLEDFFNE